MKKILLFIIVLVLTYLLYKAWDHQTKDVKIENYFNTVHFDKKKQNLILAIDFDCNSCRDELKNLQVNPKIRKKYNIFISPRTNNKIEDFFAKESISIDSFYVIKNKYIQRDLHSGIRVVYPSYFIVKDKKIMKVDFY